MKDKDKRIIRKKHVSYLNNLQTGKLAIVIGTIGLGFWLVFSGSIFFFFNLLWAPLIDFLVLFSLIVLQAHYHTWKKEFDRLRLISFYGSSDA